MRLVSFGKVGLEGCGFSRPKPLLLLAYITLEGPQERRRLAELFWKEGGSRALGNLSVVLAQFKKEGAAEAFPAQPGINPLPSQVHCDALEFLEALEDGRLSEALGLYQGAFLQDLGKPLRSLKVSDELLDWVLEKRELLAQKAQGAMLALAQERLGAAEARAARALAERAYSLAEAPEMEPALLSHVQRILAQTGSELRRSVGSAARASLKDLPALAQRVFLSLVMQPEPNLTIVRGALGLSLSELAEARETLILSGLIAADNHILAEALAHGWLETHPGERLSLLLALARATPPEAAFELYRQIFAHTQGFGGVGDFQRARAAYSAMSKAWIDQLKFAEAAAALEQLRSVERISETDPDPQSRFLEAYALERLGRFKEALELLQALPQTGHDPNTVALRSVLLWRTGKSAEAKRTAQQALSSSLDWLWARATANNTLGYLAVAEERFLEAASLFKKAASLYQAAGEKSRWVGSLNNYAIALDRVAEAAEKEGKDQAALERLQADAEQAYQQTLEALGQSGENPTLRARILLNLGMLWRRRKDWARAEKQYLEALTFAEQANALEISARLQLNLGVVYLQQQQTAQARSSFTAAIDHAARAGEFLIQGQAVGNLAFLDSDPDTMEVALELIEQSGNQDILVSCLQDYEAVLKRNFEGALLSNNAALAHQLLTRLSRLYERLDKSHKADKVESALQALLHMRDTRPHKDLLLALIANSGDAPLSAEGRN